MIRILLAALSGVIFGLGLTISQMINPEIVLGFFDVLGEWNPSLAFVMAGALSISIPGFWWVGKKSHPLVDGVFHIPTRKDIDTRLVVGAIIFGIGWALVGLCPGPAFTGLGLLEPESWIYAGSMCVGLVAGTRVNRLLS